MTDFLMPRLGADMEEATLVDWKIRTGDHVRRGQVIADVDTAKGVIEIECFDSGVVEKLVAAEGQTLPVGAVLAVLRSDGPAVASSIPSEPVSNVLGGQVSRPMAASQSQPTREKPTTKQVLVGENRTLERPSRSKATPLARRRAAELGVDLNEISGTGGSGEITAADVEQFRAANRTTRKANSRNSTTATTESRDRLRTAIAAAMAKSKREIPHYYLQSSIDMTCALQWLEQVNQKRPITRRVLPIVLSLKALALALRAVPELNGHWKEGKPMLSDAIHIGFAIAMKGGGLVAPAVHHVDRKNLDELMAELHELIPRARNGPLRSSEMTDATITLTSLGDLGVTSVFGVIYPPQIAIVGLGKITPTPCVENGNVVIHPVMTASLSGDHRASDGQTGARLLEKIQHFLQHPDLL